MDSIVSNVETKGSLLFWYLFLSPNGKPAALLVVFYSSSTTDQLQTVSSYLDSGKLIFDKGKLISIVSKQRICSNIVCFFSPGLLSSFSTNHPNKLLPSRQADQHSATLVRQEGITVLSHFSPSAQRHHYAVPNSNRARIRMGQAEFHYPSIFQGERGVPHEDGVLVLS